jgi:hypothetical protein
MGVEISKSEIEIISSELAIPFQEEKNSYNFIINKHESYKLEISILNWGQYIYVSILKDTFIYPVEHIEFFQNESANEILEILVDVLKRLKNNESRVSEKKNWFGAKTQLELLENGKWSRFGYPGRKIIKK